MSSSNRLRDWSESLTLTASLSRWFSFSKEWRRSKYEFLSVLTTSKLLSKLSRSSYACVTTSFKNEKSHVPWRRSGFLSLWENKSRFASPNPRRRLPNEDPSRWFAFASRLMLLLNSLNVLGEFSTHLLHELSLFNLSIVPIASAWSFSSSIKAARAWFRSFSAWSRSAVISLIFCFQSSSDSPWESPDWQLDCAHSDSSTPCKKWIRRSGYPKRLRYSS